MPTEIKRVSYVWNSALEEAGEPSCFLDVFVSRDREMVVDIHQSFKSREELLQAMEDVIPVLEEPNSRAEVS